MTSDTPPMTTTGAVAVRHGGPEVLEVGPWMLPDPAPDDVRIRIEAAGISFADLLVMQGVHPERRKAPFVPGWDVVGEVEAIGSAVTDVAVGDRVAGLSIVGGWAQQVLVPAARVLPVPPSLESTRAVCLVMDYVVGYQMLTRLAHVQAGDTVLVQGAGGGVGTALMQLARTMGVWVLGTDRAGKRGHIEAAGATLIDFESEDVVARCRELTGGRGVEAGFDGIGTTALTTLEAIRRGGTLVWYGSITFLTEGRRDPRKIARTAATVAGAFAPNLLPGGKRTSFYSIQMLARKHPEWYRSDLGTLLDMLVAGEIDPQIAAVWKLDEVPTALAGFTHGARSGKQVIAVA